jgi:hypothetical protein
VFGAGGALVVTALTGLVPRRLLTGGRVRPALAVQCPDSEIRLRLEVANRACRRDHAAARCRRICESGH